jgi:hypothetical protein
VSNKNLLLTLFAFLFSIKLTAQQLYFKGKEFDPRKTYVIILSNGTQASGKILNIDTEKGITIYFSKNSTYTYKYDQVISIRDFAQAGIGVGCGFGIPYGVLGGYLEVSPVSYLSICGGIGTTVLSGMGWSVGTKIYMMERGYVVRPFGSAYYGTNGVIYITDEYLNEIVSETYDGFSIGGGLNLSFDEMRKHEILLELLYIINPEFFDRADALKQSYDMTFYSVFPVKFAIGYMYRF